MSHAEAKLPNARLPLEVLDAVRTVGSFLGNLDLLEGVANGREAIHRFHEQQILMLIRLVWCDGSASAEVQNAANHAIRMATRADLTQNESEYLRDKLKNRLECVHTACASIQRNVGDFVESVADSEAAFPTVDPVFDCYQCAQRLTTLAQQLTQAIEKPTADLMRFLRAFRDVVPRWDALDDDLSSLIALPVRQFRTNENTAQAVNASDVAHPHARQTSRRATSWRAIQVMLVQAFKNDEPYTSVSALAKKCGCSSSTVQKAIKPSPSAIGRLPDQDRADAHLMSVLLRYWQAQARTKIGAIRMAQWNDVIQDRAHCSRTPDPVRAAELADSELRLRALIEESTSDERTRFLNMEDDKLRDLIDEILDDPDRRSKRCGISL